MKGKPNLEIFSTSYCMTWHQSELQFLLTSINMSAYRNGSSSSWDRRPPWARATATVARRILVFSGCIWNSPQILLFEKISASSIECLSFTFTIGRICQNRVGYNWGIKLYQIDVTGFLKDKVHTCLSTITGTHKNVITWCCSRPDGQPQVGKRGLRSLPSWSYKY